MPKYSVLIHVKSEVEYLVYADDEDSAETTAENEFASDCLASGTEQWRAGKQHALLQDGDRYLGTRLVDTEVASVELEGVGHFGLDERGGHLPNDMKEREALIGHFPQYPEVK